MALTLNAAMTPNLASPQLSRRPAPVWSYLVADLRTGAILDEIPLADVQWSKQLNGSGSLSGTWTIGVSEQRDAYTLTTPAKSAIYAVRDSVPMWGGIIWTRAYDSATRQVKIGAGDFGTYFDHRKVVPLLTAAEPGDVTFVARQSIGYTQLDQNEIARRLVALAQSHQGGNIGIELDDSLSGYLRDRTYYGYELSTTSDVIAQLCNIIDGPDYLWDVAQGTGDTPRRVLRLGTPLLGQQGSSHVWEVGGNVMTYQWPSDGSAMATRTYAAGDGIEEGALIAVAENSDRYNTGWPLLEAETGYTSVTDPDTLNSHAQSDLAAARLPIALPTLAVRGDMAPFLGEFNVGDDGRLVIPAGDSFFRNGLEAPVRVVSLAVSPETDEGEQVSMTVAPLIEDVV